MRNRCLPCLCVQIQRKDAHSNVNNKRICKDGPVFLSTEVESDGYECKYCRRRVENPVTVASGTFGSGAEFADYVDINKLGAVTTKGVANVPVGRKSDSACG